MNAVRKNQTWIATCAVVASVSVLLAFQKSSAQVKGDEALRALQSAEPALLGKQAGGGGSGSIVMDGDWLYVVHGNHLYKVQKSTMSVFQTIDLN
jgi:hypothetical protein